MYILVDKKQLNDKGIYPYAEVLPDGRAVLPVGALKAAPDLENISYVSKTKVLELMKSQPLIIENELPVEDNLQDDQSNNHSEELSEETTQEI